MESASRRQEEKNEPGRDIFASLLKPSGRSATSVTWPQLFALFSPRYSILNLAHDKMKFRKCLNGDLAQFERVEESDMPSMLLHLLISRSSSLLSISSVDLPPLPPNNFPFMPRQRARRPARPRLPVRSENKMLYYGLMLLLIPSELCRVHCFPLTTASRSGSRKMAKNGRAASSFYAKTKRCYVARPSRARSHSHEFELVHNCMSQAAHENPVAAKSIRKCGDKAERF